jgi:hypothetical protein
MVSGLGITCLNAVMIKMVVSREVADLNYLLVAMVTKSAPDDISHKKLQ